MIHVCSAKHDNLKNMAIFTKENPFQPWKASFIIDGEYFPGYTVNVKYVAQAIGRLNEKGGSTTAALFNKSSNKLLLLEYLPRRD